MRRRLAVVCILLLQTGIHATQPVPKVLILPFKNTEQQKNYGYIERSLTEAVQKLLRKRFVFREPDYEHITDIILENRIFTEDLYNKSVALTVGHLARQDIVIAGGYRVEEHNNAATIITDIYILDAGRKKIISAFRARGPASAEIFTTIEQIAERIAAEASKVLPSKDNPQAKLYSEREPLLSRWSLGLRGGGGLYLLGYADALELKQPALSLVIRANVAPASKNLYVQTEASLFRHGLRPGANVPIAQQGFELNSSNVAASLAFSYAIPLGIFALAPKIGGGYCFQQNEVLGGTRANSSNYFPFAQGGIELLWQVSRYLFLVAAFDSYAFFEDGRQTLGNFAKIGVNLQL